MNIVSRKTKFWTTFCLWVAGCGFFALTLDPADVLFASIVVLVACIALLAAEVW